MKQFLKKIFKTKYPILIWDYDYHLSYYDGGNLTAEKTYSATVEIVIEKNGFRARISENNKCWPLFIGPLCEFIEDAKKDAGKAWQRVCKKYKYVH